MKARKLASSLWARITPGFLLKAGILTCLYVLLGRLGLSIAHSPDQVSPVWPAAGLSLVALLLLGMKYWPAVFIGAFITNATVHEPYWVALGVAVGNTLEALVGAYLLQRFGHFKNVLNRPRDLLVFGLAAVVSTVVAALIGPAFLTLGGLLQWSEYWETVVLWSQGDMMGILVLGPFLLAFTNREAFWFLRNRWLEAGVLLASVLGISVLVFGTGGYEPAALPYLIFPLLVWAAVRFTQVGVVSAVMVMVITAVWGTHDGIGPFAHEGSLEQNFAQLQLFIAVSTSTALFLAMAITQRMAAEARLRLQTAQLERVEDDLKDANRRVTRILAGILDDGSRRRSTDGAGHQAET